MDSTDAPDKPPSQEATPPSSGTEPGHARTGRIDTRSEGGHVPTIEHAAPLPPRMPTIASDQPGELAARPVAKGLDEDPLERSAEVVLGRTDQTRAANEAARALARTARAFTFYEPQNAAIRNFIDELKATFERFHGAFGDLTFEIRPFELVHDGESVYVDRDRERSLASKLHRDGLRRLTIRAGAPWDEITQLLEVLSIRYVGLRLQEDDIVTMLWRRPLEHVAIEAVEGFALRDDDGSGRSYGGGVMGGGMVAASSELIGLSMGSAGGAADDMGPDDGGGHRGGGFQESETARTLLGASGQVPHDFDLPGPQLPPTAMYADFHVVPTESRDALLGEAAPETLPDNAVVLVDEILRVAADPTDLLEFRQTLPLLRETRSFVFQEGTPETYLRLLRSVLDFSESFPDAREQARSTLDSFVDADTFALLVHKLADGAPEPNPILRELVDRAHANPLPVLLDVLERERGDNARLVIRQLIEARLPAGLQPVIERLQRSEGTVAADLLRCIARTAPEATQMLIRDIVERSDTEIQLELLSLLAPMPMSTEVRTYLAMFLKAKTLQIRLKTLAQIAERGERGAVAMLAQYAETRADADATDDELDAVGRAIAQLDGARAIELFRTWTTPRTWIDRLRKRPPPVARVAIGGLQMLDDQDADTLLEVLEACGDPTLAAAADSARSSRRRRLIRSEAPPELSAPGELESVGGARASLRPGGTIRSIAPTGLRSSVLPPDAHAASQAPPRVSSPPEPEPAPPASAAERPDATDSMRAAAQEALDVLTVNVPAAPLPPAIDTPSAPEPGWEIVEVSPSVHDLRTTGRPSPMPPVPPRAPPMPAAGRSVAPTETSVVPPRASRHPRTVRPDPRQEPEEKPVELLHGTPVHASAPPRSPVTPSRAPESLGGAVREIVAPRRAGNSVAPRRDPRVEPDEPDDGTPDRHDSGGGES